VGVSDARRLYDELTDDLLYDPAIGRSTMMGFPCVRRAGRFFASFDAREQALVVKLPRQRVAELIADGTGAPFAPNGRVFREWLTVVVPDPGLWEELLAEAHEFAAPAQKLPSSDDDELADRLRTVLSDLGVDGVREQRMFGGLAFLVDGNMAVAVSREGGVLLSVARDDTDALLQKPHTRPMVMRGRELSGWLRVDPEGIRTKRQLTVWVKRAVGRVRSLPPT
jgi:hypothetical protein